jgi:hypothetical protein
MAEFVRLYHSIPADEAQRIIEELVTREVPIIQEIMGQPVFLKDLQPRDQALVLLYNSGTDRGASLDELSSWLRVKRKDHLLTRLRTLDKQRLESVQVFRRLFRLVLSRRDDLRVVTIL